MKKVLINFFVLFCGYVYAQTQPQIILQSGSNIRAFTNLDSTILAATNGDIIFIPGGTFLLTQPISKRLTIYGNGYRSDSAGVSKATVINNSGGTIFFKTPTISGGLVSGVEFSSYVKIDSVQDLTFRRCRFLNGVDGARTSATRYASNINFTSCVIQGGTQSDLLFGYSNKSNFSNCVFEISGISADFNGANLTIDNSIFFEKSTGRLFGAAAATITVRNSIIFQNAASTSLMFYNGSTASFNNNLILGNGINITDSLANVRKKLTFSDSVFVRSNINAYQLGSDYHLKTLCQCNDKGIYSGQTPFKDVPEIPYVFESALTPSGNQLQFRIKVKSGN